jgi:hypothetical protein
VEVSGLRRAATTGRSSRILVVDAQANCSPKGRYWIGGIRRVILANGGRDMRDDPTITRSRGL